MNKAPKVSFALLAVGDSDDHFRRRHQFQLDLGQGTRLVVRFSNNYGRGVPLLTVSADQHFRIFARKLIGELSLILSRSPRIPISPQSFIQFWTTFDWRRAMHWRYTEQLSHTFRLRLGLADQEGHRRDPPALAAYGGLRAGEIAALKVSKVNVLDCTVTVDCAASEVRGEFVIGPTKTGRSRVVSIPRFLATMIGEHIGKYPAAEGLVFSARKGGPVRHRNLYRRHFKPAIDKARTAAIKEDRKGEAIPETLRFHDLRHTCAALFIANGRHMEEVKDHLGHSSMRVTSDRYGHLFPSARAALAEGLEAVFQEAAAQNLADKPRTQGRITTVPKASKGQRLGA